MFPVLETDRLRLREIQENDLLDVFNIFKREDVAKYYGQDAMKEIGQAGALIAKFKSDYYSLKGIRWGIVRKEDSKLIGSAGYHLWNQKHKRADIGYELHPDYWGMGYGKEAACRVVEYGFEIMKLNRISAVIFTENTPSNNLLAKIGFKKEGLLEKYMMQNGQAHDVFMYSLINTIYKTKENVQNEVQNIFLN